VKADCDFFLTVSETPARYVHKKGGNHHGLATNFDGYCEPTTGSAREPLPRTG